jgi:two-component system sensor histidine kinase UhpB
MSLRLKINLIVGVLTALFVVALLGQQFRSMRAAVGEEVVAANRVASQLLNRSTWSYSAQGVGAMQSFLQGVGRVRSNDIRLYDAQGRELYRSPPSPYKPGRDAPEWFARLVAPSPTVQSFDFPDGRLVVRSDASRAVLDAWDEFRDLAVAAAALLLVLNALVLWAVGRAVRPFGRIVDALNDLQAGRFDVALPPLPGREAAAIGAAFNRMVAVLGDHLEAERRAIRAERELSDRRELAHWIEQQIEHERRLIARELHDELGQSVTAMRSIALSIARRAGPGDPSTQQAAQVIADEASKLYDAMHGLIPRLAPLVLDRLGLEAALRDLVERIRRSQPGVAVELHVALGDAEVGVDAALAVYRAAQEGITNALRHAQPTRLQVRVESRDGQLMLEVRDDGQGPPPQPLPIPGHYGLRWIAERVEALGGDVRLERAAPRGAQLCVRLPQAAA